MFRLSHVIMFPEDMVTCGGKGYDLILAMCVGIIKQKKHVYSFICGTQPIKENITKNLRVAYNIEEGTKTSSLTVSRITIAHTIEPTLWSVYTCDCMRILLPIGARAIFGFPCKRAFIAHLHRHLSNHQ